MKKPNQEQKVFISKKRDFPENRLNQFECHFVWPLKQNVSNISILFGKIGC